MRLPTVLSSVLLCAAVWAGDSDEYEEDEIDWQCGADDFSKFVAENQIDQDCPKLKVPINNCCLTHDDCYDKQRGRKFCDDTFCACLANATQPSALCHREDGPLFCNIVRQLGDTAYEAAGNASGIAENTTEIANRSPVVLNPKFAASAEDSNDHGADYYSDVDTLEKSVQKLRAHRPTTAQPLAQTTGPSAAYN